MSSSSRLPPCDALMPSRLSASLGSLVVVGKLGRVRVGCCQVGEAAGGWSGGLVDAVADHGTPSGVDELCEEGVHDVVVQRPSSTGAVCLPAERGGLYLEERPLLEVGLGHVDDEEVGDHHLRQGVADRVAGTAPVDRAVEAVPEVEVGVQTGPVGAAVGVTELEGVLHVVEVTYLQVSVHLVEL